MTTQGSKGRSALLCFAPCLLTGASPIKARGRALICAHPSDQGVDGRVLHVFNVTNGIELMDRVMNRLKAEPPDHVWSTAFCRIQSSLLEQNCYDQVLDQVDANIMMHLAMGHPVFVYDVGSRSKLQKIPRSIWYGIPWIAFAISYLWFGADSPLLPERVMLRGQNVSNAWRRECSHLSKRTKKRIRYYRAYAQQFNTKSVRLYGAYPEALTEYDAILRVADAFIEDFQEANASAKAQ